jgi:broad specificity phosphatase PhoE
MFNYDPAHQLIGYIVRHGETDLNAQNRWRGWDNPELNEDGVRAAGAVARYLSFEKIGRLVSSDFLRAQQTAEIIMDLACVECQYVAYDPNLRSWAIGSKFSGKEKTPELLAEFKGYTDNPERVIEPDGESLTQMRARNDVIFQYLAVPYKGLPTVVICHTSNVTATVRRINEEMSQIEDFDDVIAPGGLLGVYMDEKGNLSVVTLLGEIRDEIVPEAS